MPKKDEQVVNDWELESGLPDDFDFWITRAEFGYLPEYTDQSGAQVPLLIWYGEAPGVDIEHIAWSLGKGWEPIEGGRKVKHVEGKQKFVATSMYGRLIKRVIEELGVDMNARGSSKVASVWEGLGFHMKREEIEFKGLMEDRGGKTSRLMPVSFLGERKSGKTAVASSKKEAPAEEEPGSEKDSLIKKLKAIAKVKSREEFQKLALDMHEVNADEDLLMDVLDDTDNGFWARARRGE